jgi:hypothetical protein
MIIKLRGSNRSEAGYVSGVRCPGCQQLGTFEPVGSNDIYGPLYTTHEHVALGVRRCPNPECRTYLFIVTDQAGKAIVSYPAQRIDFDSTGIPPQIVEALEEAITCYSDKCFIAAAIMVRKTLEELCRSQGANGANLRDRIRTLGGAVVLPAELLVALDELRLLGNDAAHVESQAYERVGGEEVGVAIEVAKAVLKATYQYTALLDRLRSLRRAP